MHHVAAVNDMGGNDSGFLICPPESTCIFLEWKMGLTLIFVTFFVTLKLKKALQISVTPFSAEREGFEPPEPFSSTVFKTAVIDHSTTSPILSSLQKYFLKGSAKIVKILFRPKV